MSSWYDMLNSLIEGATSMSLWVLLRNRCYSYSYDCDKYSCQLLQRSGGDRLQFKRMWQWLPLLGRVDWTL
jgi:hypothetical protein